MGDTQREIERLSADLKKANSQAEHFEREWYLRGDEIERLRAKLERVRAWIESTCPQGAAEEAFRDDPDA